MSAILPIGSMWRKFSAHEHFNLPRELNRPAAIRAMLLPSEGRPVDRRSTRSKVRTTTLRYDTASHRRRPNEESPDSFVTRGRRLLTTSMNGSRRLEQLDQIA